MELSAQAAERGAKQFRNSSPAAARSESVVRQFSGSGVRLGVLDFGLVPRGGSAGQVIRDTCQLAKTAETLGFSRYWLAEHHEPLFAWACPEVILPLLGEATSRIRLGVAAFLLHFYSPLKIAEIVRALHALYPERLDIGLAAGTSEAITREALSPGFSAEIAREPRMFGRKVGEVFDFLRGRFPSGHRFADGPTPVGARTPPMWLMGSGKGKGGMILAAREGAGFSYSLFHGADSGEGPDTIRQYYMDFVPSVEMPEPNANIAITLICAETEADSLRQMNWIKSRRFDIGINVCGDPLQCREQILAICERYGVTECMVVPLWVGMEQRVASLRLLANAFAFDYSYL
jgi:luciferase family oxidoreductase group 1